MVHSRDMATAAKMTAAVVGVLALAVGLWYARTAILLAFAGILLAIVLFGASRALAELTKLPRLLMLAAAVLTVALFFAGRRRAQRLRSRSLSLPEPSQPAPPLLPKRSRPSLIKPISCKMSISFNC